ncbi:hypothetical protein ACTMU2_11080 [Cupriavidus basilensis]
MGDTNPCLFLVLQHIASRFLHSVSHADDLRVDELDLLACELVVQLVHVLFAVADHGIGNGVRLVGRICLRPHDKDLRVVVIGHRHARQEVAMEALVGPVP